MSIALTLAFLTALLFSVILTPLVRNWAARLGWMDTPKLERHVHKGPIPRIGGVAIFVSTTLVLCGIAQLSARLNWGETLSFTRLRNLLIPSLIIFLLGLYDDLRGVRPHWKVLVQVITATMLFLGGYGIHRLDLLSPNHPLQPLAGLALTILWVLLITNAFNLIDGLDGLAAGSALFSTLVVFALALMTPNALVSITAAALAGALLGFLRFNFHPASIFLGDSGSLFIGFMLSALSIAESQKAPTVISIAIPILFLVLPILDVSLAVARRLVRGKPLFEGDRDHIHHKLLRRGLPQREAVLLLYGVTACFGLVSLLILHHSTAMALILAVTGVAVIAGLQQLRYAEFGEVLAVLERATHRRQFVTNHVEIRRAVDDLEECRTFGSLCQILQQTLQPIGFDGIRFQMLHPNGYAATAFQPLLYEADGRLQLSWCESDVNNPPWELRLELVTASNQSWGYFSLLRSSYAKAIALDFNVLTDEFRTALAKAVERACSDMGHDPQSREEQRPLKVRRASSRL